MKLRPYQEQAIQELRDAHKAGARSIILEAPTGSGKTVVFSEIARSAQSHGRSVLIITDRLNLNDQTNAKLRDAGAGATVMTVQTAIRRVDKVARYDIIIIDEAHKRTFDNFIIKMREMHGAGFLLIGFTATPIRQGATKPLCDIYEKIISVTTIKKLILSGFLVKAKAYGAPFAMDGVKVTRGDYDAGEMFEQFDTEDLYNDVVQRYKDHAAGSKAIVFCINVRHSKKTCAMFRAAGIKARHLDGTATQEERAKILEAFKKGLIRVLCNCDLYTTGFDEPSIETVILNRATRSLPLFLQMCGRGSRPFEAKGMFNIIDMGNNVFTHGFWQQHRTFSLDPVKPPKAGVAPVKDCFACGAIIPSSATECIYCGETQPVKKKKEKIAGRFIELDPAILERDTATMTFTELDMYRKLKGWKFGWLVRRVCELGRLEEFAAERAYGPGWLKRQIEFYNYKPNTK